MALQLISHTDPRRFYDLVIDYLHDAGEAENSVMIGLAERMRNGYSPNSVDEREQPILWTVQDGSRIEMVALQTLKTYMHVSRAKPDASALLAEELDSQSWTGTDLIGAVPTVGDVAGCYGLLSGRPRSLTVRLGVFELDRVIPPKGAPGFMRRCDAGDRETLAVYLEDFFTSSRKPVTESWLDRAGRMIHEGRVYGWVDGGLVSMAASSGGTRNGIRIAAVYTPPKFRGRGYASNLVACLTQTQLDAGRRFCFLNTDLANPTSNSIYQKMGYRMVSESARWTFEKKG